MGSQDAVSGHGERCGALLRARLASALFFSRSRKKKQRGSSPQKSGARVRPPGRAGVGPLMMRRKAGNQREDEGPAS
ncbi:unnamed protein product [Arctogadus glacialis]